MYTPPSGSPSTVDILSELPAPWLKSLQPSRLTDAGEDQPGSTYRF
jgi:hypothetical protein